MGEAETPSIGFAAGIERIALMGDFKPEKKRSTVIMPIGNECLNYAINIAKQLRSKNIITTISADGKIGKRMQNALNDNAQYAIFIGSEEEAKNVCKLKDLDQNSEQEITISELANIILEKQPK